ncbi:MAG: chemotaxis protein CheX, partial [Planctomycetota bacterium]
ASGMLMSEFSEFTTDIIDAIGEVSNMIAGNVKTKITAGYGEMMLSIPIVIVAGEPVNSVVSGNLPISCFTKDPWLVTNFASGNESFIVGLLLKETK